MLLLVTIGLVVVAAAALLVGFVNNQLGPIYVSIVCSALAGLVLVLFSRLSRRHGPAVAGAGGPTPLSSLGSAFQSQPPAARPAAPALTPTFGSSRPAPTPPLPEPAPEAGEPGWADEPWFPIEDYDDMRVAEILPLLPELDLDELDQLREHEAESKARASVLIRIDELIADLEEVSAGAGPEEDVSQVHIEDYDDLRVSDILPLLSELDDDELEEVATRERQGMGRATILSRINRLLGVEDEEVVPAKPAWAQADEVTPTPAQTPPAPVQRPPAAERMPPDVERMAPAKIAAAPAIAAVANKTAAPVEIPAVETAEPTPAMMAVAAKAETAVETVEPPPAPAVPVPPVPPVSPVPPVPPVSPVPPLAAPAGPPKPRLAMKAAASAIKKPPPVKKAVTKQAPAAKRR